jgi:hypothetical protein
MNSAGIIRRQPRRETFPRQRLPTATLLLVLVLAAAAFGAAFEVGRMSRHAPPRPEAAPTSLRVAAATSGIIVQLSAVPPIDLGSAPVVKHPKPQVTVAATTTPATPAPLTTLTPVAKAPVVVAAPTPTPSSSSSSGGGGSFDSSG